MIRKKYTGLLPVVTFVLACCNQQQTSTEVVAQKNLLPVSKEAEAIIIGEFPGAMPVWKFSDSLIRYVGTKYGVEPHQMLLGASTCVDDIIYTKNFHLHPEIKGPFHLGGLGGLPFTGASGLDAFAHHVPEGGTMVLIIEPHIGYSEKGGWGYVLRHEQHESSSCCGALMGTLGKLQKGSLKAVITEEDYQGGKIAELALNNSEEILKAKNPIIELTMITSRSADEQILKHILDVDLAHVRYVVIITGVLINTDYQFCDYEFCDRVLIYDVSKKAFVEELKNTKVLSK